MTITDIKFHYRIEDVIGQHMHLKRQGTEHVGNCPFHDDHHASLKISSRKQKFKCFVAGCGATGDMFDFFTMQGHSLAEAKNIITGGSEFAPVQNTPPPPPEPVWTNATPSQESIPDPLSLRHPKYNSVPSGAWAYHDAAGNVTGFTCRFDLPEGKKDVLPYTYKTDGKTSKWKWGGFDLPRPLYNLHELTSRPAAIVLVVEGEKTAEAAKRLFPQYVVTTWIGGSESVKNADWTPLHGRKIYLWNDNDMAGIYAMFGGWSFNDRQEKYIRITGICEMFEANFKRIQNSQTFPKKWDVADAVWTPEEAFEYLKANRMDIPAVSEYPPNELPLSTVPSPDAAAVPPAPPVTHVTPAPFASVPSKPIMSEPEDDTMRNSYFKCLGFENNEQNLYVFFVYRTNVIVKLSPGGINTSNLLQLAPLNYWEGTYPKATKTGGVKFEINTVADNLISTCSKMGIFNSNKIRGRGAWIDNGVPVIHCGDILIVDGVPTPFSKHKSKYIYEAGQELGFELTTPLAKEDANKLIQMLERLNWARDINARLMAGWIVIAPLCGALNWRSHMWLTGSSGAGKSEIMKLFVKKLMGQMFVDAQGATTEAGIRQFLKADALPVVFDEAESEDRKGSERMMSVLEIMRASSTSDGGKIIKGSSGGNAAQFNIRSCFAFASIGSNLTQRSDISRITVLEIKPDLSPNKKEKWQETLSIYYETVTEEFLKGFQSRSLTMLPTILKNAATFSNAAAAELDNQRTGDQLGALLAGAYSLYSDSIISFEDARKWIKERDWSEERLSDSTRDEIKILNAIVDSETTVETIGYGKITRTIGELLISARGDVVSQNESTMVPEELAISTLKRIGIRVEGFHIVFSDTSAFISKALQGISFGKNYPAILARVEGAEKLENTTFGSYAKSRATKIHSRIIFGDMEHPGMTQTEIDLHS